MIVNWPDKLWYPRVASIGGLIAAPLLAFEGDFVTNVDPTKSCGAYTRASPLLKFFKSNETLRSLRCYAPILLVSDSRILFRVSLPVQGQKVEVALEA